MIESTGESAVARCDGDNCDEVIMGYDFQEVVESLKEAGWKFDKDIDGWSHLCPYCREN